MLMRMRILEVDAEDARPIACARDVQTAEVCAAALSRYRYSSTLVVVDQSDHETPEPRSYWNAGRRVS